MDSARESYAALLSAVQKPLLAGEKKMTDEQFFGWSRPVELLARSLAPAPWPKSKKTWLQQRLIDIKRFPWPRTQQERDDDFRFSDHIIDHAIYVDGCEWCEAMKEQGNERG